MYNMSIDIQSANKFLCMPFLTLLENGETLVNVDSTSDNFCTIAEAQTPACDHITAYGPIYRGRLGVDEDEFTSTIDIDLTTFANQYAEHYAECELRETSPLVLQFGIIFLGVAAQTFSADGFLCKVWHTRPRTMGGH
jgi:hypothetical protein